MQENAMKCPLGYTSSVLKCALPVEKNVMSICHIIFDYIIFVTLCVTWNGCWTFLSENLTQCLLECISSGVNMIKCHSGCTFNGEKSGVLPYMLEEAFELFHHECITTFPVLMPHHVQPVLFLFSCPSQSAAAQDCAEEVYWKNSLKGLFDNDSSAAARDVLLTFQLPSELLEGSLWNVLCLIRLVLTKRTWTAFQSAVSLSFLLRQTHIMWSPEWTTTSLASSTMLER